MVHALLVASLLFDAAGATDPGLTPRFAAILRSARARFGPAGP